MSYCDKILTKNRLPTASYKQWKLDRAARAHYFELADIALRNTLSLSRARLSSHFVRMTATRCWFVSMTLCLYSLSPHDYLSVRSESRGLASDNLTFITYRIDSFPYNFFTSRNEYPLRNYRMSRTNRVDGLSPRSVMPIPRDAIAKKILYFFFVENYSKFFLVAFLGPRGEVCTRRAFATKNRRITNEGSISRGAGSKRVTSLIKIIKR